MLSILLSGVFSSILAAVLIAAVFVLPIINSKFNSKNKDGDKIDKATSVITESKHPENSKTPNTTVNDKTVTFIVTVKGDSLLDTVISSNGKYKNTSISACIWLISSILHPSFLN